MGNEAFANSRVHAEQGQGCGRLATLLSYQPDEGRDGEDGEVRCAQLPFVTGLRQVRDKFQDDAHEARQSLTAGFTESVHQFMPPGDLDSLALATESAVTRFENFLEKESGRLIANIQQYNPHTCTDSIGGGLCNGTGGQ